jgi:hypothetical protein
MRIKSDPEQDSQKYRVEGNSQASEELNDSSWFEETSAQSYEADKLEVALDLNFRKALSVLVLFVLMFAAPIIVFSNWQKQTSSVYTNAVSSSKGKVAGALTTTPTNKTSQTTASKSQSTKVNTNATQTNVLSSVQPTGIILIVGGLLFLLVPVILVLRS